MRDEKIIIIIMSFVMAVASVFIIASIRGILYSYKVDRQGVTVTGKVSTIEHVVNTDTNVLVFYINYAYNSKNYTIHNNIMDSDSIYKINQLVHLKLLPEEPDQAIINSKKEKYTGYLLPLATGIIVLVGCGGLLMHVLKKQ